jgi:hypothetical protein
MINMRPCFVIRSIDEKLNDLKCSLSQYRKRGGSDASTPDGLVPLPHQSVPVSEK